MKVVVLSPHLDDAVFSCGGAIAEHVRSGIACDVLTFFAGDAPGGELSPRVRQHHEAMGNHPDLWALRREEDRRALGVLGATPVHHAFLDAMYRLDDRDPIFVEPGAYDPTAEGDLAEQVWHAIRSRAPAPVDALYYAPLGVGGHRDHLLVHHLARRLCRSGAHVRFYEDIPYVLTPNALEAGLAGLGPRSSEIVEFDEAAMAAKIRALLCYGSQASLVLGSADPASAGDTLGLLCRGYASFLSAEGGFAERCWRWQADVVS